MKISSRGRENRRNARVEVSKGLWVAWRSDGPSTVSRVRDLSMGGIFIETQAPLEEASRILLLFSLPEGEIRIEGLVRYKREKEGMGVEFTSMSPADRVRLRELVQRLNA